MHNKDKVIFDKKLPYEYNICLYILEELCDTGVINVFEMAECGLCARDLRCHERKDYRRHDKFYNCHIGKHSHDIYCSSPYYDHDLLDHIFINILKN